MEHSRKQIQEKKISRITIDVDFGKSQHHSMQYNEAITLLIGIAYNIMKFRMINNANASAVETVDYH
jgi:hypothetical protein